MRGSLRLALQESMKEGDAPAAGGSEGGGPRRRGGRSKRAAKSPSHDVSLAMDDSSPPAAAADLAPPTAGRKRPPEEIVGDTATNAELRAKIDAFLDGRIIGHYQCRACGKVKKVATKAPGEDICMACAVKRLQPPATEPPPATEQEGGEVGEKPPPKKRGRKKYFDDGKRRRLPPGSKRVRVTVTKPSKDATLGLRIRLKDKEARGVWVDSITSDSLFHGTDLKEGMEIESVDGTAVGGFDDCLARLKEAEGEVTVVANARSTGGGAGMVEQRDARYAFPTANDDNDDDLLPEGFSPGKKGCTPVGRLKSCCCPHPSKCRAILFRWARLKESKYNGYRKLPGAKTTKPGAMPSAPGRAEHGRAYREAALRALGYPTDGSKLTRTIHHGPQETTADKVFSEYISLVHFHPAVLDHDLARPNKKIPKNDRWRVPLDIGEKIGLSEDDKCPTLDTKGEQTFFALPNYSLENATADIERAEEQYKQKARDFQAQNKTLVAEMASNPSKYVMRLSELEQQNAKLIAEVKELKGKLKKDLTEKNAMQRKHERLERGLEKIARRMDKMESTDKIGGITNRDAKEIYKWATGKDLSEEGFFGVAPTGGTQKVRKGQGHKMWTDPRMDRALQAKWENPAMSMEEALRKGGFVFPSLEGKYGMEKHTLDADGISMTDRKQQLYNRLGNMRKRLKKKAAKDPEVAREYAERFPEVEPVPEGVYCGLDLRGIPDQPLVRSKASNTGYRGVKKTPSGRYTVQTGTGEEGQKKTLGTFATLEEAAAIYAKAKFYLKQHGYPKEWRTAPAGEKGDEDTDPNESGDEREVDEPDQVEAGSGFDHQWYS